MWPWHDKRGLVVSHRLTAGSWCLSVLVACVGGAQQLNRGWWTGLAVQRSGAQSYQKGWFLGGSWGEEGREACLACNGPRRMIRQQQGDTGLEGAGGSGRMYDDGTDSRSGGRWEASAEQALGPGGRSAMTPPGPISAWRLARAAEDCTWEIVQ